MDFKTTELNDNLKPICVNRHFELKFDLLKLLKWPLEFANSGIRTFLPINLGLISHRSKFIVMISGVDVVITSTTEGEKNSSLKRIFSKNLVDV